LRLASLELIERLGRAHPARAHAPPNAGAEFAAAREPYKDIIAMSDACSPSRASLPICGESNGGFWALRLGC
jgi:hypothetical protein